MSDQERSAEGGSEAVSGWLPPSAPGAGPPRRWDAEAPTAPAQAPAQPSQQQPVAFVQPYAARPSNGQAIAALVLGICGLAFLLMTFGIFFPLNLTCSILGWIFGVKGRRRADSGEVGQRGMAQAGFIMGIIGTVLGVLAVVAWVLLFALGTIDSRDFETNGDTVLLVAEGVASLVGR